MDLSALDRKLGYRGGSSSLDELDQKLGYKKPSSRNVASAVRQARGMSLGGGLDSLDGPPTMRLGDPVTDETQEFARAYKGAVDPKRGRRVVHSLDQNAGTYFEESDLQESLDRNFSQVPVRNRSGKAVGEIPIERAKQMVSRRTGQTSFAFSPPTPEQEEQDAYTGYGQFQTVEGRLAAEAARREIERTSDDPRQVLKRAAIAGNLDLLQIPSGVMRSGIESLYEMHGIPLRKLDPMSREALMFPWYFAPGLGPSLFVGDVAGVAGNTAVQGPQVTTEFVKGLVASNDPRTVLGALNLSMLAVGVLHGKVMKIDNPAIERALVKKLEVSPENARVAIQTARDGLRQMGYEGGSIAGGLTSLRDSLSKGRVLEAASKIAPNIERQQYVAWREKQFGHLADKSARDVGTSGERALGDDVTDARVNKIPPNLYDEGKTNRTDRAPEFEATYPNWRTKTESVVADVERAIESGELSKRQRKGAGVMVRLLKKSLVAGEPHLMIVDEFYGQKKEPSSPKVEQAPKVQEPTHIQAVRDAVETANQAGAKLEVVSLMGKPKSGSTHVLRGTDETGAKVKIEFDANDPASVAAALEARTKVAKQTPDPAPSKPAQPEAPEPVPETPINDRSTVSHADVDALREELGWTPREKSVKSDSELLSESQRYIGKERAVAQRILDEDGATFSDPESVAVGVRLRQLKREMEDARLANDGERYDLAENEANFLADALDKSGTEQGRAFRARRFLLNDQWDPWTLKRRATKRGVVLDETKSRAFEEQSERILELEAQLAAVRAGRSQRNPKTRESIAEARALAISRLKTAAPKAVAEVGMAPVSSIIGAGAPGGGAFRYTAETVGALKDLARTYIDDGILTISELTERLRSHIRDADLEDSPQDLRQAAVGALGDYRREMSMGRKAYGEDVLVAGAHGIQDSDIARLRQELDAEWGAVTEIDGRVAKAFHDAKRELNDLEDLITSGTWDAERYEEIRQRVMAAGRILRRGSEFGDDVAKIGHIGIQDPEILELRTQIAMAKHRAEYLIERFRPRGVGERAIELANLPRTLKASLDLSAPGRQGWFGLFVDPKGWAGSWSRQAKAFLSEKGAEMEMLKIMEDEGSGLRYVASGLEMTDWNIALNSTEEAMMGNLIGRSAWRKYNPMRASDRAFNVFLNHQRASMFDSLVKKLGPDASKKDLEGVANFVNIVTGRGGSTIPAFKRAAEWLSFGFFAPRFLASRIELVSGAPLFRSGMSRRGRLLLAQQYGKMVAGQGLVVGAILYGARALFGEDNVKFVSDPTSSDFGKILVRDEREDGPDEWTRVDTGAGALQPVVLASRLALQRRTKASGEQVPLSSFGESSEKVVGAFYRTKANPAIGTVWNAVEGENMIGEPFGAKEAFWDLVAPLTAQEIVEGIRRDGFTRADAIGLLNLLGISVNTYGPRNPQPKSGD